MILKSAIERQLEIVGEALNRALSLDSKIENQIPEARKIIGLRNRVIHGYDAVDDEIVWDIVKSKIPVLQKSLCDLVD